MKSHWASLGGAVPAFLLGVALAQAQVPPSANALLDRAETQAAASHRAIFLIFGASW